jgi:hypothetical protein
MRTLSAMIAALWLGGCAAQSQGPFAYQAAQSKRSVQTVETRATQRIVNVRPPAFHTFGRASAPELASVHETVAAAAGVPILNSEASCHLEDHLAVDQSVSLCLSAEGRARDQLAHKWTEFPSADRSHCMRYSGAGGGGTYTDLLTCLEMELYVRNLHMKNRAIANQ